MINKNQIDELLNTGGTVVGSDGEKIGKFGQVFLDDQTGEPQWVTVRTGLFGMSESFVPLDEASVHGDTVTVPFDKQIVKDAPRIDDEDGHLSPADEQELYRYYNRSYDRQQSVDQRTGRESAGQLPADPNDTALAGGVGNDRLEDDRLAGDRLGTDRTADAGVGFDDRDTVGRDRDAGEGMTRSEEQLRVGTENVETGRARLRKYVVTENVTTTVPVSHEEVRVEREPITDADAAGTVRGGELGEEEQEVTLHAERPVVDKEAVPVEKVRLDTETVTDEEKVTEQVRKERIEAEGDGDIIDPETGERTRRTDR
ncbi:Stress response protein YsnF [Glutamicibacter creatinolyticus]|uniref:Stress response protein YsnF n=1 Tax=Glutamicibacter creatinolyticus TaxID=162496 RepID=A0A5B7WRV4_9MICC|nr:PRC and DUF2382 domain-containing protein [Glutamicibacter creatinolyticus]QCY46866.1 Stress response protein YsnF [Glutamicibacter creatinolyticus]